MTNFRLLSIFLMAILFLTSCEPVPNLKERKFRQVTKAKITGVSPSQGVVVGGETLTISGSFFQSGISVTVGGASCTSINVISSSVLTCLTPAHIAGGVDIIVSNDRAEVDILSSAFTYLLTPYVNAISPNNGILAGGTSVTVTGSGFSVGDTVSIGGVSCSSVTILGPTTLTCTTSPHSAGSFDIVVTGSNGQVGTLSSGFIYNSPPTVTSVLANAGALGGGTFVTITGTGFASGAVVDFGGATCSGVSVLSGTTLTCTTPSHAAGVVTVTVTNADTQTGNLAFAYTYQAAPTISSISPNSGFLAGGNTVTITGTGFLVGATATIGGVSCTSLNVVSSTSITCTTGAHSAANVDVVVVNTDSQSATLSSGFTYDPAPTVTSVSPSAGALAGGTTVTITGTNFISGAAVTFGSNTCSAISVVSATSITCTLPTHAAGSVSVTVANPDTQTGILASGYTYQAAPTLTSVTNSAGGLAGGTAVTLTGTGFLSGAAVDFGGFACTAVSVVSSTSITCTTPSHAAGAVNVTVTNADTQSVNLTSAYTYQAAPSLTLISPTNGIQPGGTAVTLTGTGFVVGASVTIGGVSCTGVSVVSATSITCNTGAHGAGLVSVVVTNADTQSATLSNAYTYDIAPAVTSVTPNAGALAGGTTISITGSNFISGASVKVGGSVCSSVSFVSSTHLTCTLPTHASGAVSVSVTNPDNQVGNLSSGYTYQAVPTITSVTNSAGTLTGGTSVTVTGTGFVTGASVDFGGSSCSSVNVVSGTSLTCTTSGHVAGAVTVTVTNADTQSGNLASAYTYQAAPTVSAISPNHGILPGGSSVTITGTGFVAGATVSVGYVNCSGVTVVSATSITCTTGAHASGVANVIVTNADTQNAILVNGYTYDATPTVGLVSPNAGALAGGSAVTISGSNFVAGASVDFGGSACTAVNVVNSTSITCTTSTHVAGAVTVTVTNPDTQSGSKTNGFTYQVAPTVSSVSPTAGALTGGTTLTVTGTGFVSGAAVSLGGANCSSVTVVSSTSITCITSGHVAGTVAATVTNADSQAGNASSAYTYQSAPSISMVSPNGGALTGGSAVTISGSGFLPGATIDFSGSACTGVTVVSVVSITCTTTAHSSGPVVVTVTNSDGQNGVKPSGFTYQAAPTITSISANHGILAGGTAVTITGTGFLSGAALSIGGSTCTSLVVVSSTSMTCITGSHAAGAVNVVVTNADSQTATLTNGYTYDALPTISSVSPNAGALSGGTSVTITGTGFLSGISVDVGGGACTSISVVSSTSLTCTTPSHAAGAVTVTVTNTDTQSGNLPSAYTYQGAPAISGLAPSSGAFSGGTTITITGTGFISGMTVDMGGAACSSISVSSSTTLTCVTPAHAAGFVTTTVTNPDTQNGSQSNSFLYLAAPTITTVSPSAGSTVGGTTLTITGTGYFPGASVDLGGVACLSVNVVSATSITCITPGHGAAALTVTVTNTDSQSGAKSAGYTFQPAPTVSSVSLNSGALAGGTSVTVTGTGFVSGASVDFGGSTCSSVNVVSGTSLTCTTSSHAAGAVSVTVTNADSQSGNSPTAYTYQAAPTVSSISANAGALGGGTSVTITGTGFLSGATVDFGGSACSAITVVSSTSITCTTSTHSAGSVSVSVTNTDNQVGSLASGYTYQGAPTLTLVTNSAGALGGGTVVTLTGTGFISGASVDFGGSACTGISVVSATSITCTTGAHAAGAVTVSVTNVDTQSGNKASAYTYQAAPTATLVSPNHGILAGGTSVTITGTGFVTGASVSIGGAACSSVSVVNSTSITCTTGASAAGLVNVIVTNADTQAGPLSNGYTYDALPTITSVSPSAGAIGGGTAVTLTGTGFLSGAVVDFGGVSCTSITVVSPTSITCTTGAHAVGSITVTVTNTDTQSGNLASGYSYQAAPTVTAISPNTVTLNGGQLVSITGTGFISGATVTLGGSTCTGVSVVSSTSITCSAAARAAGAALSVDVTNTDTQVNGANTLFTYQSQALMVFVTGSVSPTPPDPDNYGSTTTNITHTYTLRNDGDTTSGIITISKSGTGAGAWLFGTDNCSGFTLAGSGATCTVQMTFLGGFLSSGPYSALIQAVEATNNSTGTNTMQGTVP